MSPVEQLAAWVAVARNAVAFSGAGVSTESGIPDFRSPGGVWATSRPVYYDEFLRSATARQEYWRQKAASHADFLRAEPNVTHQALAKWESAGMLRGVVTQNIDGLHQIAGSRRVLELHGTAREVACLDCRVRFDADVMVRRYNETGRPPPCERCGGITKHATISFGQALPEDVLQESIQWCRQADLFIAMGSSLVVHPAAGLPVLARESGSRLVIINRDATPVDSLADLVIHEPLGETFEQVLTAIDDDAGE